MSVRRQLPAAMAVAVVAFATDFLLLHLLVSHRGLHYLLAASLSFAAGTLVSYGLSLRFVFSFRRLGSTAAEFSGFALVGLAGLALNAAVMYSVVEGLGLHYLVAKCGAAGCTFFFNFLVRRAWLFTPPTAQRTT